VLVIQWLQARLTLFSNYFSSFPHGTCSLSDSRRYLALDEIYHLIYAPVPGNATPRFRTLRRAKHVLNWAFTIRCASFQKTYTCRPAGHGSRYYNAEHEALLLVMSSSFFIRHYLKNPFAFLFHHLLICLNSEGNFNYTRLREITESPKTSYEMTHNQRYLGRADHCEQIFRHV
jgi:hypothetical protein